MTDVFDSPTSPSSVGRFPAVGISLVLCLKILISLVISVECVTKVEIVAVSLPVNLEGWDDSQWARFESPIDTKRRKLSPSHVGHASSS